MKKISFKSCLKIVSAVFLLFLAIHYWQHVANLLKGILAASAPLVIGFGIAYVVNMIMSFYEKILFFNAKKKFFLVIRRTVCVILAFATLFALLAIIIGLILPQLIECVKLIISFIPNAIEKGKEIINKYHLLSDDTVKLLEAIDWKSQLETEKQSLVDVMKNGITEAASFLVDTLIKLVSGTITAFISFIFALYLLFSKEKLKAQAMRLCRNYLPKKTNDNVLYVVGTVNDTFRRYLIGQCTEAVILGMLCAVGMMILSLPYAVMISTLVAFTALIPIAGAYIGAAVGALMILTVSPAQALVFLVFILILQQLEGNLIYPRVVGSSLGLPGIWVLASITIGGGVAGIGGMFLSVPLVASIYRLVDANMTRREETKNENKNLSEVEHE